MPQNELPKTHPHTVHLVRREEPSSLWKWGAAAVGTALAASAIVNAARARRAERDNPPIGEFLNLEGVRLHYLDRGSGPVLVLIHGNGTMIEDWLISGLIDRLAAQHRVIAFDRPGFGHSSRPRGRLWTPGAQADLIAEALMALDADPAHVVAHSFGTLVALSLALDHPALVTRLSLISGYYFPSARLDVVPASTPAIPVVGDVMRHSVSPWVAGAMMPRLERKVFAPAPVDREWHERFPQDMALRPSQIRAEAEEAAMMIPAAASLARHYGALVRPVTIIAGRGDALVDQQAQAVRLNGALPDSRLVMLEGVGHMLHHSAPEAVEHAIRGA